MPRENFNNLSSESLLEGTMRAIRNAQCLIDEAQLLHDNEMYARSYALSHFAREEFGKSFMLMRAAIEVTLGIEVNWKELNKRFRDHKKKIVNDNALSLMLFGESEVEGKKLDPDMVFSTTNHRNNRKNECLYVDWGENGFVSPKDIVTKEKSERNLSLAEYRVALLSPHIANLAEKLATGSIEEFKRFYPTELQENPEEFTKKFLAAMSGDKGN